MYPLRLICYISALLLAVISPSTVFANAPVHGCSGCSDNCGGKSKGVMHNPMLWADVPDPDVIRVGDDYYMVSTTMHLMPGCPVMHSKDLVNWETIGYVFDRLTDTPRYDLIDGTVYGKGQWATSLRYRDGVFYVLFSPNDQPYRSYIYKATDPAGPWELITRTDHFHDASLLLDDDGRAYVFYNGGEIRLRELESDLSGVKEGGVDKTVIFPDSEETGLHEGSRVVKHDGKYYAFVISWPAGKPRRQLCYRADNIEGPYEKMVVLESQFGGFPYVGQGCLVDGKEGDWWGVIFQDRGGVGRVLTLNPVEWKDGWPMLGDKDGKVPAEIEMDLSPEINGRVAESDDFNGSKSIYWQWNHNPIDSAWSLTERPGYLRLKTSRLVPNLFEAPNTISQRMEGPECEAEVKLDVAGMKPGDKAGLAAFNGDSGLIYVDYTEEGKFIVMSESSVVLGEPGHKVTGVNDKEIARVALSGNDVYLKIDANFNPGCDIARFYWSLDGADWHQIGGDFKMIFDYRRLFMGTRFAIFNYATQNAGGYVDVDSFKFDKAND
ncbi:MAG: glycoside hydrolase 43 family protein [Muribaculaceae bacterium]|nr:glycoside hydrolase 43 family protein [Muribaculaceae bacterium]